MKEQPVSRVRMLLYVRTREGSMRRQILMQNFSVGAAVLGLFVAIGCGGSVVDAVDDGEQAIVHGTPSSNPSVVLIQVTGYSNRATSYCSGSIVGPRAILTVAHCLGAGLKYQVRVV